MEMKKQEHYALFSHKGRMLVWSFPIFCIVMYVLSSSWNDDFGAPVSSRPLAQGNAFMTPTDLKTANIYGRKH